MFCDYRFDPAAAFGLVPAQRASQGSWAEFGLRWGWDRQVACGSKHSMLLLENGLLFCWGWGGDGQLGLGDTDDRIEPTLVECAEVSASTRISHIAGGGGHSLAVDSEGSVYSWGANQNGQLGHSDGAAVVLLPAPIRWLGGVHVQQLSAGGFHSLALSAAGIAADDALDGVVFAWGCGRFHPNTPAPSCAASAGMQPALVCDSCWCDGATVRRLNLLGPLVCCFGTR